MPRFPKPTIKRAHVRPDPDGTLVFGGAHPLETPPADEWWRDVLYDPRALSGPRGNKAPIGRFRGQWLRLTCGKCYLGRQIYRVDDLLAAGTSPEITIAEVIISLHHCPRPAKSCKLDYSMTPFGNGRP